MERVAGVGGAPDRQVRALTPRAADISGPLGLRDQQRAPNREDRAWPRALNSFCGTTLAYRLHREITNGTYTGRRQSMASTPRAGRALANGGGEVVPPHEAAREALAPV